MAGIFKAYDIRGTVPDELYPEMAYKIGKGIAKFIGEGPVVIGRDMRKSGMELSDSLVRGIVDMGVDVINIGVVETPMVNYATATLEAKGGVMITASHNPAEYNGFKICREEARPVSYETGINLIEKYAHGDITPEAERKGVVVERDLYGEYVDYLMSYVKEWKPLKIVVDAGNGMAGKTIPRFFEALEEKKGIKVEVEKLFFELDGTFPNHDANPLKEENTKDLSDKVRDSGADLGIAFDGDADRSGYVDEKGRVISNDFVATLIAMEYLRTNPGSTILYDVRSSWSFPETVEEMGGTAKKCKVGHAYIKEALRKENAIFAGELSGHYYFQENFHTDSGIIAMIMIINLMCAKDKKISELVGPLMRYYASGEINSTVNDPEEKMNRLEEKYKDGKVEHIDGISVEFDDWWFNVRKSNTEPTLRLNLEAKTESLMIEKRDELLALIRG